MIVQIQEGKKLDVLWVKPVGKLDIDSSGIDVSLKFEFSFGLPLVELLAMGIDEFSFSIKGKSLNESYQYFSGDIDSMEADINEFFASEFSLPGKPDPEFSSYFYKKYSLANFISDEKISQFNSIKSYLQMTEMGETGSRKATIAKISKKVFNEGNFLLLSNRYEPQSDLSVYNMPEGSQKPFKACYKELSGVYSSSIIDLSKVQYPRNLVNYSFLGEVQSSDQEKINIGDSKKLSSFWALWKKMFNWNPLAQVRLPEFSVYRDKYFPCTVKPRIDFSRLPSAQKTMTNMFMKDALEIEISFYSKGTEVRFKAESIKKNISLSEMLKRSTISLKKPIVKVSNMETHDRVYVTNPNKVDMLVWFMQVVWDNEQDAQSWNNGGDLIVPALSESWVDVPSTSESRYYDCCSLSKTWADLYEVNSDTDGGSGEFLYPVDQVPWDSFSAIVPGVYKRVDASIGDPNILCIKLNDAQAGIYLSKVSPYIDEFRYYIKRVSSSNFNNKLPTGKSRTGWIYLTKSPSTSNGALEKSSTFSLENLYPGRYQIVCDLYRKGSVVDSISTFYLHYNSPDQAAHGITFDIDINPSPSDMLGSVITITENKTVSEDSSSIVNAIIDNGTLVEPLNTPYEDTWATSKTISSYMIERYNLQNGAVERITSVQPLQGNQTIEAISTAQTTKDHVYRVKQYAANIGQLVSTIMSKTTTPLPPLARGNEILYDYAKFKSQKYIMNQTLPDVTYQLDGSNGWPILALGSSGTGVVKSESVSRSAYIEPSITRIDITYDPYRRSNIVSWVVNWNATLTFENSPRYWLITGTYGGVTSIVSTAVATAPWKLAWSLSEKKLAGALGEVKYKFYCVFPDGSISESLGEKTIEHSQDKYLRLTMGRGY